MTPAPFSHCIEQSLADLGIVDKIDITKTAEPTVCLLVISWIDESGNPSYRLARFIVCHEENRVAEAEGWIAVGIEVIDLVADDGRHIAIVALVKLDGELDKALQLLASSDFPYCDHRLCLMMVVMMVLMRMIPMIMRVHRAVVVPVEATHLTLFPESARIVAQVLCVLHDIL